MVVSQRGQAQGPLIHPTPPLVPTGWGCAIIHSVVKFFRSEKVDRYVNECQSRRFDNRSWNYGCVLCLPPERAGIKSGGAGGTNFTGYGLNRSQRRRGASTVHRG